MGFSDRCELLGYHQSFVLSWMTTLPAVGNKIWELLPSSCVCAGGSCPPCLPVALLRGLLQQHRALRQLFLLWVGLGQGLPGSAWDAIAVLSPDSWFAGTLCRGLCSLLKSSVRAVSLKDQCGAFLGWGKCELKPGAVQRSQFCST